jgi:hypothetical protein
VLLAFFIDSVGTGEIREGPLTFGGRIRRVASGLLSRYSPVWVWRELKASDARCNGWPVVTEIQVDANGTEQNRAERVADVSAALVLLSFVRVHYGEWLYCFFRSMERKQASERSGVEWQVAKSKSLLWLLIESVICSSVTHSWPILTINFSGPVVMTLERNKNRMPPPKSQPPLR